MADRSAAAKKAAETRRLKREAEEYAEHNQRRKDPATGRMELVSDESHPEVLRHPIDPLPDPVDGFSVQRQGSSPFADGAGQVALRWSGPGVASTVTVMLTVTDEAVYDRLVDPAAPWWDVTLTPRRDRP